MKTRLPALILLAGILRSFVLTTWTLTYLEITDDGETPDLLDTPETSQEPAPEETDEPDEPEEDEPEPIPDPDG